MLKAAELEKMPISPVKKNGKSDINRNVTGWNGYAVQFLDLDAVNNKKKYEIGEKNNNELFSVAKIKLTIFWQF